MGKIQAKSIFRLVPLIGDLGRFLWAFTLKLEYPSISKAFLRSDNTICYHNGPLILSLPVMGERTGVMPLRYDFSDPQAGKDICDRKTAPMKAHIRRWVDERHDVITAEGMKQALE